MLFIDGEFFVVKTQQNWYLIVTNAKVHSSPVAAHHPNAIWDNVDQLHHCSSRPWWPC